MQGGWLTCQICNKKINQNEDTDNCPDCHSKVHKGNWLAASSRLAASSSSSSSSSKTLKLVPYVEENLSKCKFFNCATCHKIGHEKCFADTFDSLTCYKCEYNQILTERKKINEKIEDCEKTLKNRGILF